MRGTEPSDAPELYAIARFVVPRIAADALDLPRIVQEARDDGMIAANIETAFARVPCGLEKL